MRAESSRYAGRAGNFLIRLVCALVLSFVCAAGVHAACSCDDGQIIGDLSCCGGDGERPCNPQSSCSVCTAPNIVNEIAGIPVNCMKPREMGEACGPLAVCRSGLDCKLQPWEPAMRCVDLTPDVDENTTGPLTGPACDAFYTPALADAVKSSDLFGALTFGAGASVGAALAEVGAEIGIAYGKDGSFGCYYTTCEGVNSDPFPAVGVYLAGGFFTDFSVVNGDSIVTGGAVSFSAPSPPFPASAGVSVSLAAATTDTVAPVLPVFIGTTVALGVSAGTGPDVGVALDGMALLCQTNLSTSTVHVPPDPGLINVGPEQWVKIGATGANPNGHSTKPWHDLDSALNDTNGAGANNFPELFIEGVLVTEVQGQDPDVLREDGVENFSDNEPRRTEVTVPIATISDEYIINRPLTITGPLTLHSTGGELTIRAVVQ